MKDTKNEILHQINRLVYQANAAGIPVRFSPMYGDIYTQCIVFGGEVAYDKQERGLIWKEKQDDKKT